MSFNKPIYHFFYFLLFILVSFNANAQIVNTTCLASKHYITQPNQFGDIIMKAGGALNFKFNNGSLYISETTRDSKPYKYGTLKYTGYNSYLVNSNMLVNVNSSGVPTKAAIVDAGNINVYWLYCS